MFWQHLFSRTVGEATQGNTVDFFDTGFHDGNAPFDGPITVRSTHIAQVHLPEKIALTSLAKTCYQVFTGQALRAGGGLTRHSLLADWEN